MSERCPAPGTVGKRAFDPTTHKILALWGWCPREECQDDERQAVEMALKHADMMVMETNQSGAVQAQESGAQMEIERDAFAHTEVGLSPHMTTSKALKAQIFDDAARALSATRRARKVQHRRLMPQTDQSLHAMRAEAAEDGTQKHDQAKPEAQKSTPPFHEVKGNQDQQQHDHRWLQYSPAGNGALYHQALAGVDGRYIYW
jgi:hypothetical protein